MTAAEEWRTVAEAPMYQVSDLGRVRSLHAVKGLVAGRILTGGRHKGGYRDYHLHVDGRSPVRRLGHRLVAEAFLGPRPEGMEIRHLDGDPTNNPVSNLAYGTRSENMQDALRHGSHPTGSLTHCKRGHEFSPANTMVSSGRRNCRTCGNERNRRRRAASKAAAIVAPYEDAR